MHRFDQRLTRRREFQHPTIAGRSRIFNGRSNVSLPRPSAALALTGRQGPLDPLRAAMHACR
jgi:hypothetical protein